MICASPARISCSVIAHLRDTRAELRRAADLHGDILRAIGHGDPAQASQASLRLNDYLTDFTYQTLRNQ
jgi:DNA-binding FadR family transcriptional regulator